uniref:Uncharacterized protein n=1 Tax=Arundo donax TaxID=35708 RepID=A0A0A8YA84_ARUDO
MGRHNMCLHVKNCSHSLPFSHKGPLFPPICPQRKYAHVASR